MNFFRLFQQKGIFTLPSAMPYLVFNSKLHVNTIRKLSWMYLAPYFDAYQYHVNVCYICVLSLFIILIFHHPNRSFSTYFLI